ncbi:VanW family protein [Candidatus Peregrinibacteria bacterium]|nr:VanW family protein [Candidatus Peregrinibacteria bacterium]
MKNKFLKLWFLALVILPFLYNQAEAAPASYGREYGLFVHEQNKDLGVPDAKGHQVLASFFEQIPPESDVANTEEGMTQREFLLEFEKLRLRTEEKKTILSDKLLYPKVWLKARRYNWLPDANMTFNSMREFLYRYSVSQKFGGIPYFEGLVLDESEITPDNYGSINQVASIIDDLEARISDLRRISEHTNAQKTLLKSMVSYSEAFAALEEGLRILNHPLNKIKNLPEDIRQKIIENDLNEILGQISYNYSHNNANRIHNLLTGVYQLSGQVFMPEEEINFEKELGRDGWWKYKYGWVIFGGTEAWQFGGGLCGAATMTFTPSWEAGLEIIRRFPHSVYYRSLYPTESLGLDATIYRGHKNLIMKNNTGSPILYYVENNPDNKEVTMYLIGNSPYKNIVIEGPNKPTWNTYKWIRRMERFDGTVLTDELVTKYGLVY